MTCDLCAIIEIPVDASLIKTRRVLSTYMRFLFLKSSYLLHLYVLLPTYIPIVWIARCRHRIDLLDRPALWHSQALRRQVHRELRVMPIVRFSTSQNSYSLCCACADIVAPATSSPLHFPTSSSAGGRRAGQGAAHPASQSSNAGPLSSAPGSGRRVVRGRGETPLFLPG